MEGELDCDSTKSLVPVSNPARSIYLKYLSKPIRALRQRSDKYGRAHHWGCSEPLHRENRTVPPRDCLITKNSGAIGLGIARLALGTERRSLGVSDAVARDDSKAIKTTMECGTIDGLILIYVIHHMERFVQV